MSGAFAVGKIPSEPEFLRGGGRFDAWLYEAVCVAFETWGGDWSEALRDGSTFGFFWNDLCGVLAPSRDSVGRDYPLAIVFSVPKGPRRALLPASGAFFARASALLAAVRTEVVSLADFERRVRELQTPGAELLERLDRAYDAWLRTAAARDVWRRVQPAGGPLVADSLPREGLLRLPVHAGGMLGAAVLLDVVERTLDRPRAGFWDRGKHYLTACHATPLSLIGSLWPARTPGWIRGNLAREPSDVTMREFLTMLRPS